MAEITGATVTYTDYTGTPSAPRLLNVPDAWGDVKVQDLVDTLSAKQAELDALVYDALLDIPDTSGKQVLSATKSVGITCASIRTQVKFEDLAGPGYTIKRVTDGNFVSIDNETDRNQIEEMANSDFVNWKTEADVSAALLNPDIEGLPSSLMSLYGHRIWIDVTNGSAGAVLGTNGTEANRVNNLADALTLAAALGVRRFDLTGSITLTAAFERYVVEGNPSATVNMNGQSVERSTFYRTTILGTMTGFSPIFVDCILASVVGYSGTARNCGLGGTGITLQDQGASHFIDCRSVLIQDTLVVTYAGTSTKTLTVTGFQGSFEIAGMAAAGHKLMVTLTGDRFTVAASNTLGSIVVAGSANLVDNGGGVTLDSTGLLPAAIEAAVWDAAQADHTTAGTTGESLDDAARKAALAAALAAAG